MDALRNLSANIPDWVKRLEELSSQIEQRQIELAKFAEANKPADPTVQPVRSVKSVRNKGSTESLRPTDEPATQNAPQDGETTPNPTPVPAASATPEISTPAPALAPSSAAPTPSEAVMATVNNADGGNHRSEQHQQQQQQQPALQRTPSATHRQQRNEVIAAAQARARAHVQKRIRSDSVVSAEGALPSCRSKSMVIVYYDSYVQSFFEELVKFVSASRNLMRKAKMAAKVAHIKRMAEMEVPDCGDDGDDDNTGELKPAFMAPAAHATKTVTPAATPPATTTTLEPAQKREGEGDGDEEELPPLKYISTRQMYANSRVGPGGAAMMRPSFARAAARAAYGGSTGLSAATAAAAASGAPGANGTHANGATQTATPFDSIDKGLEFVQSMCEQAAHQFLRDGDCDEEIGKIKTRLSETNVLAGQELERRLKEGPAAEELLAQDPAKSRSYRLQTMRRESASPAGFKKKEASAHTPAPAPQGPVTPLLLAAPTPPRSPSPTPPEAKGLQPPVLAVNDKLEADDTAADDDYEIIPKLVYKSTRNMMRSGVY